MPPKIHNPFDVVMKRIVEDDPLGLLRFLGLSGAAAEPFDADLSTISPQADYVLRVSRPDYLAHIEFQSSYAADMGRRMLLYGALAHYNHRMPVESVLVLLRKEADGPEITGIVDFGANVYRYKVVRLWELSPEALLTGPVALLPLAPLANVAGDALPNLMQQMSERIEEEPSPGDLWAKTMLLMGLKFDPSYAQELLERVMKKMKDSRTYQAILEEGRVKGRTEGEQHFLLRTGTRRFGVPDARTVAALEAITSQEALDRLADRLFEVGTWEDLLR